MMEGNGELLVPQATFLVFCSLHHQLQSKLRNANTVESYLRKEENLLVAIASLIG